MGTLIYDGDCGVCTVAADWVRRSLAQTPKIVTSQSIDPTVFGLTAQQLRERVWLATAAGNFGGHLAIAELFRMQRDWRWRLLGNVLRTPPYSWLARAGYGLIARNRHRIRVGPVACSVPQPARAE